MLRSVVGPRHDEWARASDRFFAWAAPTQRGTRLEIFLDAAAMMFTAILSTKAQERRAQSGCARALLVEQGAWPNELSDLGGLHSRASFHWDDHEFIVANHERPYASRARKCRKTLTDPSESNLSGVE